MSHELPGNRRPKENKTMQIQRKSNGDGVGEGETQATGTGKLARRQLEELSVGQEWGVTEI